jgi:surface protein
LIQTGCGRVWPGRFPAATGNALSSTPTPTPSPNALIEVSGPILATGTDVAAVSVKLSDWQGFPIAGVTPTLSVSGNANSVTCGASNASGVANCNVTSSFAETKLINITSPPAQALAAQLDVLGTNTFHYTWNIPVSGDTATLPLIAGKSYNVRVYWGDGQMNTITDPADPNRIHTYTSAGTKAILIHGTFAELAFATHPERLLDVKYWGTQDWVSMKDMFKNCTSLTDFGATTPPVTTATTDFSGTFEGAINFNSDISGWNTQAATTLARMFKGADKFNAPIGTWDVGNVTNFSEMFSAAGIPTNPVLFEAEPAVPMIFNQSLSSWNVSSATNMSRMFAGATHFNSPIASWLTGNVTDMTMMFYYAKAFNQDLVSINVGPGIAWDVTKVTSMKMMFFRAENFNGLLTGWTPNFLTTMERMFAYASIYDKPLLWGGVGITVNLTSLSETFYGASAFDKMVEIDVSKVTTFYRTFAYAALFNQALSSWNPGIALTGVTTINFSSMFIGAAAFNRDLSSWGPLMARASNLEYMFAGATSFNQDLSSWNTSGVTNMRYLFSGATSFNNGAGGGLTGNPGPLLTWNTAKVTNLEGIFKGATNFNCQISNSGTTWDTGFVTTLESAFQDAKFFNNGALPNTIGPDLNWDTSRVTRMDRTFWGAEKFDCDLPWDTSQVTTMYAMFISAYRFNQPSLSLWDVSNVTNMASVFYNALRFNQDLSSWITSKATTMSRMFIGARDFNNGAASGSFPGFIWWDTSKVTSMSRMFEDAVNFNQVLRFKTTRVTDMYNMFNGATLYNSPMTYDSLVDPDIWNTSSVTKMNGMFLNAVTFDQDISNWLVLAVTDSTNFSSASNALGWLPSEKPAFPGTPTLPTRRIFLTNATFDGGAIGGISGADAKCMADAQAAGGTYKALLSVASRYLIVSPAEELDWPLAAHTQYLRKSDLLPVVTTDGSKIFSTTVFTNPISPTPGSFWSGLNSDWTYPSTDIALRCDNWTSGAAGYTGKSSSNASFTSTDTSCATSLPLLCVEQ